MCRKYSMQAVKSLPAVVRVAITAEWCIVHAALYSDGSSWAWWWIKRLRVTGKYSFWEEWIQKGVLWKRCSAAGYTGSFLRSWYIYVEESHLLYLLCKDHCHPLRQMSRWSRCQYLLWPYWWEYWSWIYRKWYSNWYCSCWYNLKSLILQHIQEKMIWTGIFLCFLWMLRDDIIWRRAPNSGVMSRAVSLWSAMSNWFTIPKWTIPFFTFS